MLVVERIRRRRRQGAGMMRRVGDWVRSRIEGKGRTRITGEAEIEREKSRAIAAGKGKTVDLRVKRGDKES